MDIFEQMFSSFKKTAKRIESLPVYKIEGNEWEEFTRYKNGQSINGFANQDWLDELSAYTKVGKKVSRIRVVPKVINQYLIYEIEWCYHQNVLCGEDIRLVGEKIYENLAKEYEDFWIFDDQYVISLIYDRDGHFLEERFIDDVVEVSKRVKLYNSLNLHSKPFNDLSKIIRNNPLMLDV